MNKLWLGTVKGESEERYFFLPVALKGKAFNPLSFLSFVYLPKEPIYGRVYLRKQLVIVM